VRADGAGDSLGERVDRLDLVGMGRARRAIVDREGAEQLAGFVEDRSRPAGAKAVRKREMAVVRPQRVGRDVGDVDRMTDEGRGAARAGLGADLGAVDRLAIGLGEVRRGAVAEAPSAFVEQQDRGQERAAGGGFDLAQLFVEDCLPVAVPARLAFEAAVELVERAEQLRRKLHK